MTSLKPLLRLGAIALAAVALTLLTQIGGIVFVLSLVFGLKLLPKKLTGLQRLASQGMLFVGLYLACALWVIPPLAASAGRIALPCRASAERPFAAARWFYCALNRNYVDPRLAALLAELARDMDSAHPGAITLFLDANFPFIDGFPLPPHRSHNDGLKLDIAFFYMSLEGRYLPYELRSPIGYGGAEKPPPDDVSPCPGMGSHWRLQGDPSPNLALDTTRTGAALRWLATKGPAFGVEKVFIEPYLAKRLGVSSPVVRFQGCNAARHDDHIHIQIKP